MRRLPGWRQLDAHLPCPPSSSALVLSPSNAPPSEIPTHGHPIERCRLHHEQYRTMTKRYKDAQKFVDETLAGALIPSKEEVQSYTSIPTILEKARRMKKYVNAIREERTGRDIHHKRFFLKVDSGHKMRINVLAKQMTVGVEIRDALEAQAMALHMKDHPAENWMEEFQAAPLDDTDEGIQPGENISYMRAKQESLKEQGASDENSDLIEFDYVSHVLCTHPRARYILDQVFPGHWQDSPTDTPQERNHRVTLTNAWLQYTRRIIFHDPHLFAKSLNKVSLKDFVMDDDFGVDDMFRVMTMYEKRLEIGLRWWKDSITEAIAIKDSSQASANMGSLGEDQANIYFSRGSDISPQNRFKILGGWIYNNSRDIPAPNKMWWTMLRADPPEKDTENRHVRLCCNFDELHTFLSFSALILSYNTPAFCTDRLDIDPRRSSSTTRNHLNLCGVLLTDLVRGSQMLKMSGPIPSTLPAKKPGCITRVEMEMRAYMFGAIRNEPDDFTTAFLRELRARPDLFAVVTRSDTDKITIR
ncbi:hypothetical protein FB451DRAFT_1060252 [Mycena latifolia]|nr:hypothetical protein FB451DRAFT_1060252 [Mycena latifolia]